MAETESDDLNDSELASLDRALRTARPGLSSAAMGRIHAALNRELAAHSAGKRSAGGAAAVNAIQAWPLYAAIVALVLLALTMAIYSFTQTPREIQSVKTEPSQREPGYGIPRDELQRRRAELLLKFLKMDRGDEGGRARVAAELLRITPDADIPETTTPGELRFLGALGFTAPHLQWHANFTGETGNRVVESAAVNESPWSEAHAGERWMFESLPPEQRDALEHHGEGLSPVSGSDVFWTLDNPAHADVKRAIELLSGLKASKDIAGRAADWADALRRNNTVLTMDIVGAYESGKSASFTLDARAANHVTFKLYRLRQPADLLAVARRIGTDFIFADHERDLVKEVRMVQLNAVVKASGIQDPPRFSENDIVQEWSTDLSRLENTDSRSIDADDEDEASNIDADSAYFGDDCLEYSRRINKEYGRGGFPTAWRCGRDVAIPGEALKTAGVYALVAEANGQCAFAPIIVDALNLTMRRCRDGVLTVVSEHEGSAPVAGASVLADGMLQDVATDANGVAFARVFAGGDRSIIAWRDGRAAIGGFGRLFDGVYKFSTHCYQIYDRSVRISSHSDQTLAQMYDDRNIVAAYTDRPVYRPGQDVNFKLILRLLGDAKSASAAGKAGFRDEDFEKSKHLLLPTPNTPIAYEVLDAKNRAVAAGTTTLNDFGTAIGSLHLNDEAATGSYALRLNLGGAAHIVPDVFSVKSYRRPNFEVKVNGVPAKLFSGLKLALNVSAQYYFGQPVTASAHIRLVQADAWRPLAESDFKIDAGSGPAVLEIPANIDSGKYFVICAVTDDSNQTVTHSETTTVAAPPAEAKSLSSLPRFTPITAELKFAVPANLPVVKAEQMDANVPTSFDFTPANGFVTLTFPKAGWWTIYCGSEYAVIFVYGEAVKPFDTGSMRTSEDPDWVDLGAYGGEKWPQEFNANRRTPALWTLFDRQHAEVGGVLKLLVYVPQKDPRILFTFEGRTVVDYAVVTPAGKGPYYVVELPIRARHVPNFYLQACLLSPFVDGAGEVEKLAQRARDVEKEASEGDDPRWCRVDVIDPNATHGAERLTVTLESDRTNYHPGENVDVGIRVTAPDGAPRSAEVSLSAVDESVFSFGEDNLSALAGTFADARPPRLFLPKAWRTNGDRSQRAYECTQDLAYAEAAKNSLHGSLERSSRALAPVPPLRTLGQMPAGQIPLLNWREDFRETAAWLPHVRTDANGRATAKFKLPDSLTRYRLTAVGLTKETEIGTGKSALTASLPLSVQVFAPRFAIEGDQLQLTGIIRNDSDAAVTAPYQWELENALPRADVPGSAVSGKVSIEPHGSATVHVSVAFSAIGDARIGLKAGDAALSDGERRSIPVIPDGRPFEAALNGNAGADKGEIKLPAGFIPYDLKLMLSRSDPAQSLEGLGYLIEYPYGCVEQTMSRFLPAVVVKHAAQQGSAVVSDDALKRLPEVLSAGLSRLYKFQHEDGGWGWWEKDQTNQRMSVYVLYGLARCKACGVAVDASVIEKACAFLKVELKFGRLDPELTAWAWDALALAGAADTDGLVVQIRTLQPFNERARGYLALACENVNLKTDARFIWTTIKGWQPVNAEDLALKLNLDVAFGELPQARETAAHLAALRQGLRWNSTWDTARAIEALSALTTKLPPLAAARHIRVSINGAPVYEAKTPEELQRRTSSVQLSSAALLSVMATSGKKEATLQIDADCPEPVQYGLNATGYQKLSDSAATGTDVRMTRQYFSHDGKPLNGPVKNGDAIEVRVRVALTHPQSYMLVEDRRPAGFEFAADIIQGGGAKAAANVEFRDDRVCVFFDSVNAGELEFSYYLRAENVGTSHVLPGCAYPMYNEKTRGETGPATLEVVEK